MVAVQAAVHAEEQTGMLWGLCPPCVGEKSKFADLEKKYATLLAVARKQAVAFDRERYRDSTASQQARSPRISHQLSSILLRVPVFTERVNGFWLEQWRGARGVHDD